VRVVRRRRRGVRRDGILVIVGGWVMRLWFFVDGEVEMLDDLRDDAVKKELQNE